MVYRTLFRAHAFTGTILTLNYFVLPFIALGWDEGMRAWAAMFYAGHVVAIALAIILAMLPSASPRGGVHRHPASAPDRVETKKTE